MTEPIETEAVNQQALVWSLDDAVSLCRKIEAVCPNYGCHVALTGGLLYKDGPRKDCDIVLYGIRGREIDDEGLWEALKPIGIEIGWCFGWVVKAKYNGKPIDFLIPEMDDNTNYERASINR